METYLPLILTTLTEWLQLTIEHPLYAAALVIGVWLLTALLYSIRISGLTKNNVAIEQAKIAAEANLTTAQQQLQQAQDQLTTVTEQQTQSQRLADTEKQRASSAEQQLIKRNQQIGVIIQNLASSFDSGERPLPVTEDLNADDLWQQHDKIIHQLIERLHTEQLAKTELQKFYQAEKDKVSATDAQLSSLHTHLDSQNSLISTLQQQLTNALQHQTNLAQITPVETGNIEQTTPTSNNLASVDEPAEKLKSLFKKPVQQQPSITPVQNIAPPIVTQTATVLVDDKKIAAEPEPVVAPKPAPIEETAEKTSNVAALKGLYQKFTTAKPDAVKPESVVVSKPAPVEEVAEKTSNVAALKGLYQKFSTTKAEQVEIAPEPKPKPQVIEPVVKIIEETVAPIEQIKPAAPRSFTPTKRPEVKPLTIEPSSRIDEAADLITEKVDKLKNLYGKFFSKKD